VTVEVAVPKAKFNRLATAARLRAIEWKRRRAGYHGLRTSNVLRDSEKLEVSVRIVGSRLSDWTTHCYRGHELTPENIYVRPDGKARTCKECIRLRRRERTAQRRAA
jgi:hypothetical protein